MEEEILMEIGLVDNDSGQHDLLLRQVQRENGHSVVLVDAGSGSVEMEWRCETRKIANALIGLKMGELLGLGFRLFGPVGTAKAKIATRAAVALMKHGNGAQMHGVQLIER